MPQVTDPALLAQLEAPDPKPGSAPLVLSEEQKRSIRDEATQKLGLIDSLERRSREGWFATGFGSGLASTINGTTAADVAKDVKTLAASGALQRIQDMARDNGGKNPLTPLSNADFTALGESIANLDPTQSDEQFQRNLGVYRDIYRRALEAAGGASAQPDDRQAAPAVLPNASPPGANPTGTPPSDLPPPPMDGGPVPPAGPTGSRPIAEIPVGEGARSVGFQQGYEDDPLLAGVKDEYRARLAAGQNAGTIIRWLNSAGVTNPGVYRTVAEQVAFRKQNPRIPIENYPIDAIDDRAIPTGVMREITNAAADSPVGSYFMSAGDAATGFTLDNMAANPELARIGMEQARQRNPNASLAGTVSGGVLATLAAEAGLARAGLQGAGVLAPRALAADAAYGAAAGAGSSDYNAQGEAATADDRALGAVTGAAAAAGGGAAARGALTAASRAAAPTGGRLAQLYEAGVRPSPGQRFANSGMVGSALNAAEESLQSVPVVGSAIRSTREAAREQFELGAFNQALADIGDQLPPAMRPGTAPHAYTQAAFNRVYERARGGMRVVPDQQLADDFVALSDQVTSLAEPSIRRMENIIANSVTRRFRNGVLDGDGYKAAVSDLGKRIREIRNSPTGDYELAAALEGVQDVLDNAARRHSPQEAVALLDAADAGYAKLVRIEEAAKARGGEPGRFSPTQFDRAVQKTSGGTRSRAYLRGDALMQDYADQGRTLVDRLGDSGTAGRVMTGTAVAGGASAINPAFLKLLATVGLAYAPGVRRLTTGALAPAGPARRAVGEFIANRRAPVGALGSTGAVSLVSE